MLTPLCPILFLSLPCVFSPCTHNQVNDDAVAGPQLANSPSLLKLLAEKHATLSNNDDDDDDGNHGTKKAATDAPIASGREVPTGCLNKTIFDTSEARRQHFASKTSGNINSGDGANGDNGTARDSGGSGGGGGGYAYHFQFPRPDAPYHRPGPMLKVGERLTGMLGSPDETSVVFPNQEDASLVFYRYREPNQASDGDDNGKRTHPSYPVVATLIAPDPRAIKKVLRIRQDLYEEEERKMGSGRKEKRGIVGKVMRWLRKEERELARKNIGQYYLTITERGVLVSNPRFLGCLYFIE